MKRMMALIVVSLGIYGTEYALQVPRVKMRSKSSPLSQYIVNELAEIWHQKDAAEQAQQKHIEQIKLNGELVKEVFSSRRQEIMKHFLQQGADVNICADSGMPILTQATFAGDLACMKLLLDQPCIQVDQPDVDGTTALMVAASQGNVRALLMLIAHGAHINQKDRLGTNALWSAVMCNKKDAVQCLLACDDIDIESPYIVTEKQIRIYYNLLEYAALKNLFDVMDVLLKTKNFSAEEKNKALCYADQEGHMALVQLLIQHIRNQTTPSTESEPSNSSVLLTTESPQLSSYSTENNEILAQPIDTASLVPFPVPIPEFQVESPEPSLTPLLNQICMSELKLDDALFENICDK